MRPWLPHETVLLLALRVKLGNQWVAIGAKLHRSPHSTRQKYNRIQSTYKNPGKGYMCHTCGMRKKGHVCRRVIVPIEETEIDQSWWQNVHGVSLSSKQTHTEEEVCCRDSLPLACHDPEDIVRAFMEV